MATRPVFVPGSLSEQLVQDLMIEFKWYPGMSVQQKQKSIDSLHAAARLKSIFPILEISTKSRVDLGRQLSAFNLTLAMSDGHRLTVEAAFQGGKVFERGGPYHDLYSLPGREIKRDNRLRSSGGLVGFEFEGERWGLEPKTAFYDWLYLNALIQNSQLSNQLLNYKGFTDIEFNPEKSINCQARAAALFVALSRRGLIQSALASQSAFISAIAGPFDTGEYKQSRLI
jgi:hypothetical protein